VKYTLSDLEVEKLRKKNRLKRLAPRPHKIVHESGKSTKMLWQKIVERGNKK